jgi:hypothetical protein
MRLRLLSSVLVLPILSTACAPSAHAPPAGPAPDAAMSLEAARAAVTDRPAVPGEAHMLGDAALVTFPMRRGGEARRDTVRGVADVTSWLERLRSQTAFSEAPFELGTEEVWVCDGALVERGEYPLGGMVAGRAGSGSGSYLALWRPAGEAWKLAGIWLSPPGSVRPGTLASGCTGDAAARRFRFGAAFGAGSGIGLDEMSDSLAALPAQEQSGATRPVLQLWAGMALTPTIGARLSYSRVSGSLSAEGDLTYHTERDLELAFHTISLAAEFRVGPVWLEAGPALGLLQADQTVATEVGGTIVTEDASDTMTGIGAVARLTYRHALTYNLAAIGILGYSYFPDQALEETVPGAAVPLPGASLVVGLEWRL